MNKNCLLSLCLVVAFCACAKQKGRTAGQPSGAAAKASVLESKMQGEFTPSADPSNRSALNCELAKPPSSFDVRLRPGMAIILDESNLDERGRITHTKAEHRILMASADRLNTQMQILETENGPAGVGPGTQLQVKCQFDRKRGHRPDVVCRHTPELPAVAGEIPEYCWVSTDGSKTQQMLVEFVRGTFRLASGETVSAEMETRREIGDRLCASAKMPDGQSRGGGEVTSIIIRSKDVPTPFLEDCGGAAVLYKFEEQRENTGRVVKATRLEMLGGSSIGALPSK